MATVETVRGAIDASELGTTLIHEHLQARDDAVHYQWPHVSTVGIDGEPVEIAPDAHLDNAVAAAKEVVGLGVKTICDPSCMFLGRDIELMRGVAEASGLQVVPCTGIYTYDHLPMFFVSRSADEIADLFVHDIEQGIQGTDVKAAFLKCAADEPGINENVEKVHRAIARAHLRTGAPIMAHSRPASDTAPRQIEIFEEEGADLSRVQIAHCGDSGDADYIERLLERGVYAGLDRFGIEMYLPFEQRIAAALELLERGYAERLFISADACVTLDWFPLEVNRQMLAAGAVKDWTMATTPSRVVPALREGGATEEQIDTMLVANPPRWLTGS
ncbi:MAG: phosphotriesterase family protein [Solirubrobacterales bacterium]